MKTLSRYFLGFLIIFSLLISVAPTAFAEGTTMIDLSNKSPAVGDKITMTVSGTDSSTITVKFNSSVLNFSNCSVSGFTTDGNTVTFTAKSGTIDFVAASEGSSNLIVSSDALTGSSTTLKVAGGSATEESTETESAETTESDTTSATEEASSGETSSNATESYDFMYGDTAYVISKRFTESQIPEGFESTTVTIHDSEYKAISNGSMTLLYLKLASDTYGEGKFFVYDSASDSVSPLVMLGSQKDYVIVTTPEQMPSDQLVEVAYSGEAGEFSAYQFNGVTNDFYYVYGTDETGAAGWFMFDATEQTVSRANVDAFSLISATQTTETTEVVEETTDDTQSSFLSKLDFRNVIAILILVLAVAVVILINVFVSKNRQDEDYEDEEEEDSSTLKVSAAATQPDAEDKTISSESEKSLEDIVSEADASMEDEEESDEYEERSGGFFSRLFASKDDGDIWADEPEDEESSDEDFEDKNDNDKNDKNDSGNSGGNHEINLMDLNNL